MVHFAEINQAPSPYSMLQYIGRVATPKPVSRNCLRCLQTILTMGGGVLASEFMWGIAGEKTGFRSSRSQTSNKVFLKSFKFHRNLRFQHRCFPVKFAKFLRTPLFKVFQWLLLGLNRCFQRNSEQKPVRLSAINTRFSWKKVIYCRGNLEAATVGVL